MRSIFLRAGSHRDDQVVGVHSAGVGDIRGGVHDHADADVLLRVLRVRDLPGSAGTTGSALPEFTQSHSKPAKLEPAWSPFPGKSWTVHEH